MWPFNKIWRWTQRGRTRRANQVIRDAELETKLDDHKREMLEFIKQEKEKYQRRLEILDFKTELRQRRS
jgi:hypothetical protein